ncbi:hypothetical protein EV360DRAFT_69982 [Lentinula raphanica]|nr:hypothetical protein EV360DRAFT_69982 [Lentinula raphanica]
MGRTQARSDNYIHSSREEEEEFISSVSTPISSLPFFRSTAAAGSSAQLQMQMRFQSKEGYEEEKMKRWEVDGSSREYECACHASFPPLDSDSDDDKDPDSDDYNNACDSKDDEGEGEGGAEDRGEGPLHDLLTMRHTERCRIYPEGEGGVRGGVWVWVWMGDGEMDVRVDIDDDNGNVPTILDNVADRGGTTDKGKAVNETRPPPPFVRLLFFEVLSTIDFAYI